MRIGLFTESYPPLINGVSTSVQTLIAQLEHAGHDVFVFTSRYPKHRDDRPHVYRYPSFNSLVEPDYVLPIPISPRIAAAIPRLKLDIVHSQSPFLLGLLARRIARRYGLPHLSTNHTLYSEYAHYVPLLPRAFVKVAIIRWMHKFYNACDHVLAPSHLTRSRLQEYGVHAPISVVPTGIPAPPFLLAKPADTKRDLGLPPNARLLLYVGRLAPEKNLGMLLRAFRRISDQTDDTFLVLAGSGTSASALRRRAKQLGIEARTLFTGFVGRTTLDPLYAASDLFLFPSVTETQGLAVGEALAAGTPCIVVNGGGAPEAIRNGVNGFVVEDDPAQMAEHALRLLGDDALRRSMAAEALAGAALMTPEHAARRILTLYEELVGRQGGKPPMTAQKTAPAQENGPSSAPPPQV